MIYILITIFGVLSIITLKLYLQFMDSAKNRMLKLASLFVISIGSFIMISTYLLMA